MTPKEAAFCEEYVVDLNSTQAAIRAGYAKKTAGVTGCQKLKKPNIAARIEELKKERQEKTGLKAADVVEAIARIAFVDPRQLFDDGGQIDPRKLSDDMAKVVAGIEPSQHGTKIKLNDRLKALELLGRHMSLFSDKIEHRITEGKVVITIPDNGRGDGGGPGEP